jgi:hypothetical protein
MHENKHEGPRNEIIKLMAVAAMTVDHIGAFLFPQYLILRIIGRFAMPVFAYGTAMGIIRTGNREKYLARLFIFALISQVPYELVGQKGLNVISTIFITALFLYLIKKNTALTYILSLIPLAISILVPMDYGVYFLALSFAIYIFKDRMTAAFISGSLITVFMSLVYYNNPVQIFSVIGLFSACFQGSRLIAGKLPVIRLNKSFFYIYYPLHLLIIFLIKIY